MNPFEQAYIQALSSLVGELIGIRVAIEDNTRELHEIRKTFIEEMKDTRLAIYGER